MTQDDPGPALDNIKLLRVLGRHYVFNTRTARHAEVEGKTWRLVGRVRQTGGETPSTLLTVPGLASVLEEPADKPVSAVAAGPRNLILQVSHACNLRCRYCGADFGRYGGDFRTMSLATARRAVDFLYDTTSSPELAVTYFGGEPLLNMDTVLSSARHALARAERERKIVSLHLVTNGILLTPEALFRLDELGFSLTVSLDGPPALHDRCRPFPDGRGSYAMTARALRIAGNLPIGQRITVRGTFTRESSNFFTDVQFLVRSQFSRNIAYEPVFLPVSDPRSLRWQDLPAIKQAYTDLARYYVSQWRRGEPYCLWDFDDAITRLVLARPRHARCGAGVSTLAVTAEEDIYACHMSTGMKDARLGNLHEGLDEDRRAPWLERHLNGREGCTACWLRSLCGGGCNTHAISYNSKLDQPYRLECEMIEHRYRLAFWMLSEIPRLKKRASASVQYASRLDSDSGHLLAPLWSNSTPHSSP